MLAIIRLIGLALAVVIISICACIYCLFRPFHRNNVFLTAKYMGKVVKIVGLDVEVRIPESVKNIGQVVYICNHQNSYDIFTLANGVRPNTVSVGKTSLKWIPFFGQMYWLTGNILIDRTNTNKALNTISLTAKKIREKSLSIWLFPEGTRSNGRGLLPFKTGAFRTAVQADVPVVPVCASNMHNAIKLNRWDNGKLILEFLDPIYLPNEEKSTLRQVVKETHSLMQDKIEEISIETGNEMPARA